MNNRKYSHKPLKAQRSSVSDKHQKNKEDISASNNKIESDVLGSYTGVPENEYETPVQDADDL